MALVAPFAPKVAMRSPGIQPIRSRCAATIMGGAVPYGWPPLPAQAMQLMRSYQSPYSTVPDALSPNEWFRPRLCPTSCAISAKLALLLT